MSQAEEFQAPPGWVVRYTRETGSTNDLAREAGGAGATERTVFVTDHQTQGRGRRGREWLAPSGGALLFSLLFQRHQSEPFLLTMVCSVAACEAIEELAPLRAEIKWPNDLMVNGRKLGGVLTEVSWSPDHPFAVVGMGINLNFDPSTVSGIPESATSLLRETGREVSRQRLLYGILLHLDALLALDLRQLEPVARERWAARLWRRRQKVVVAEGNRQMEGSFEDVAEDGALLLRLADGTLQTVRVGDLVI
jgi:BirA family biotin operon repressor/biotin-[acetyl-CoA-carboxylase] ligase